MFGTPTSTTDPKGIVTTTDYDTFGRVTKNRLAGTSEVGYTYHDGNLTETVRTDNAGSTQSYQMAYDLWGNRIALHIGNKAISTQEYANGNGLLKNEGYTNGLSISYQYDILDRVKSKAYSDGRKLDYTYTGAGQLYSIYDSNLDRQHIYDYDSLGRVINYRQDDIWGKYAYDDCNRLVGFRFSTPSTGPKEMHYTYNVDTTDSTSDGLLSSMTMVGGDTISYQYDGLQRPYQKHINSGKSGGGIWERYLYEDGMSSGTSGRVSEKKNWIDNQTVSHDFHYTYDQVGNILTETDSHNGTSVSYVYDNQNQLTGATYQDGRVEAYTYDTVGNLLTFDNGVQSHTYTYGDSDWKDLLTAVDGKPLTYDTIGNPLHYENGSYAYEFSWSEGRRLSSVAWPAGGQTTTYEYDHNGVRTKKITQSGTVVYDLVNSQAVGETRYNADGSVSVYIRYLFDESGTAIGIGLWYPEDTAWTDYYFVKNLQGDVLQVYRESDNALAASYTYDSWGNVLTSSGPLAKLNPFRYRGYYYDTETWFYYLQSRYYDPATCRFINADSYSSTGQGILGHNMFAYCGNNPILRKDDGGEFWHIAAGAIAGALISGGVKVFFNAIERKSLTDGLITAMLSGGASGALAATGVGVARIIAGNSVISIAENAANQVVENGGFNNFDAGDMLIDGAIGGISGALGGAGNGTKHLNYFGKQTVKRTYNATVHKGLKAGIKEARKAFTYYGKNTAKYYKNFIYGLRDDVLMTVGTAIVSSDYMKHQYRNLLGR